MSELLKTQELALKTQDGVEKTFILSKFPAIAGREIFAKYPLSNVPKLGEYNVSEEIMLKLMSFVAVVPKEGAPIRLSTRTLIDNHVEDWETLAKLEWAMLEYNASFFGNGPNSAKLGEFGQKLGALTSKTLTALLAQLLQAVKQPSKS